MTDQLRDQIEARLSWSPYEDVQRHRSEAIDAAVEVVAPLLAERDEQIQSLDDRRARWAEEHQKRWDELQRAEASRRDWAAEALRLEQIAEMMTRATAMNHDKLSFVARRILDPLKDRSRCTGIAADALAWFAVGSRDEPRPGEYPADEVDLTACERTYKMAPEFLRERMLPVLERYRRHVAARSVSRPVCAVHPEEGR